MAKHYGWQWMEFVLAVVGGAITLVSFFFMKETLYYAPSLPSSNSTNEAKPSRPKVNFNLVSQAEDPLIQIWVHPILKGCSLIIDRAAALALST